MVNTNNITTENNNIWITVDEYKEFNRKHGDSRENYILKFLFSQKDREKWGIYVTHTAKLYEEAYWNKQVPFLEFVGNYVDELLHFEDLYRDYKFKKYYPLMDEVEQLKKEAEENNSLNSKLKEELKENMSRIKDLETELEEADGIIDSHEEALMKAKEWRERNEKGLKEKIEEQRDLVFNFTKSLVIKEREFDKLSESYDEEHEKLRKETKKNTVKDEKIKELEWKLYLANKSLPNLPKKSSKLKYLKNKITLKSQQLIEKVKHQSQELLARIEVKTK